MDGWASGTRRVADELDTRPFLDAPLSCMFGQFSSRLASDLARKARTVERVVGAGVLSFFSADWTPRLVEGRYRQNRALHLWVGPLGLHLFWPLWKSRFDWCAKWNESSAPLSDVEGERP